MFHVEQTDPRLVRFIVPEGFFGVIRMERMFHVEQTGPPDNRVGLGTVTLEGRAAANVPCGTKGGAIRWKPLWCVVKCSMWNKWDGRKSW